jgi:hypothetical protein
MCPHERGSYSILIASDNRAGTREVGDLMRTDDGWKIARCPCTIRAFRNSRRRTRCASD